MIEKNIEDTEYLKNIIHNIELENLNFINKIFKENIKMKIYSMRSFKNMNIECTLIDLFNNILVFIQKKLNFKKKEQNLFRLKLKEKNLNFEKIFKDALQLNSSFKELIDQETKEYKYKNITKKEIDEWSKEINLEFVKNTTFFQKFEPLENYYNIIDNNFLVFFMFCMDFYTLNRMFMTFDMTGEKGKRGPIICRKQDTPKYIIFYGGTAHTETYAYFFEKIFGAKPDIELDSEKDEDGENINACITFEKPFNFFEDIDISNDPNLDEAKKEKKQKCRGLSGGFTNKISRKSSYKAKPKIKQKKNIKKSNKKNRKRSRKSRKSRKSKKIKKVVKN